VIPHVTEEIKSRIKKLERIGDEEPCDVIIAEIGGTVGDIESLPFRKRDRRTPCSCMLPWCLI
jgi:CTP synthase